MIDTGIFFPTPVKVRTDPAQAPKPTREQPKTSFREVLEGKLPASQGIRFSRHAQERLSARGITLSDNDVQKLEGAVDSVAKKGGRESLVMLGDAAFVVSVANRTVVTALDRDQLKGNVFTNIDSAVIAG